MSVLPISRVVDVTVTRQDNFPTIAGFTTPMFITNETSGPLTTTIRAKAYGSMDEVAADWASTTEAYKMANTAFSQPVRPPQIKLGYRVTGQAIAAQLDLITAYDAQWYQMAFSKEIRGVDADEDAAIAWAEARAKILFLGSNDIDLENAADTTNVAARHKGEVDRTAVFYNAVPEEYLEIGMATYTATRNLDTPASAYTAKFKRMKGITALNKSSGVVQNVTGFTPALGLSTVTGHLANVFVNIGGALVVTEGNVLSGAFIDEIHAADWIMARTQEEVLGILTTNDKIAMTDPGVEVLASGVRAVMNRAFAAGLIADDYDDDGNLLPSYTVTPQRVRDISAAQRRQRIAPAIRGVFRYSGAVHYATVNFTLTF